ncbi:hypothetical protein CDD83_7904 [Cordyceps sp. RAO-2017]|nr:hypothetical protein CDD83_7904 [Cordyceps sp. RAO-2017]
MVSDCAERAFDIDPSGWIRRAITGKTIEKQCQCAAGDDTACRDDQCYNTILRSFRKHDDPKNYVSALCLLKGSPGRGYIGDKLFSSGTCTKEYNKSWGSGTEIDFPAITQACNCVLQGA